VRSNFGGSGDHETFFFDTGVSGIRIGGVAGDASSGKHLSNEAAGDKGFSGEVGAVKKTSSLPVSESPPERSNDTETMT
jgi:hypothetical protein